MKTRVNFLVLLGMVTFLVACFHFWYFTQDFVLSTALGFLFVGSLAIGGQMQLMMRIANRNASDGGALRLSWQNASLSALALLGFVATFFIEGPALELIAVTAPLISLTYGFARIRCCIIGCCGSDLTKVPIQLLEASYNLTLSSILIILLCQSQIASVLFVFGTAYTSGRQLFYFTKVEEPNGKWVAVNSFLFVLFVFFSLAF
ncbi:hypothetical protein [Dyadobacter sp. 22481]|uniref:hypothetical protein n=1 Tax=Dyadobacter sp. 22481 TaxID=3453926 RepID=UPI003F83B696